MKKQELIEWIDHYMFIDDGDIGITEYSKIRLEDKLNDLIQSAIEAHEAAQWKTYPENKELVIDKKLYLVTIADFTVHTCYGISFQQVGVIAFKEELPNPFIP